MKSTKRRKKKMFGIEPDLLRSYLDGRSENESQQAFGALQRHAKLL